jgi:hypothetical protein
MTPYYYRRCFTDYLKNLDFLAFSHVQDVTIGQ